MLTFLDMYKTSKVEDLICITSGWKTAPMKACVPYDRTEGGEQPVYLDIHENTMVPTVLWQVQQGSGKSETPQTYILSLVLKLSSLKEVAFILIDYKGGGMAQSFIGLPPSGRCDHQSGGNQTTRALLSIHARSKRRQLYFNEYKIKHIDAYIELYRNGEAEEPMPHLLDHCR